jgi:hypothetical protein
MREEVVRELIERLNERSGCMKKEGMWERKSERGYTGEVR